MEAMATIKFLALYGLEVLVVGVVGLTVIAGLYQLIREQTRTAARESHVPAPETLRKR